MAEIKRKTKRNKDMYEGTVVLDYDLGLFGDIMNRVILKSYPHKVKDFVESFLSNQITCKAWLVEHLKEVLEHKEEHQLCEKVTIIGSWYGNILVPMLISNFPGIKTIEMIDMDQDALDISRKFLQFYPDMYNTKVELKWTHDDVNFRNWATYNTHIMINTSCEHMYHMKQVRCANDPQVLYVLQSNNLYNIREHVSCVKDAVELSTQADITRIYYMGAIELAAAGGKDFYNRFMVLGKRDKADWFDTEGRRMVWSETLQKYEIK